MNWKTNIAILAAGAMLFGAACGDSEGNNGNNGGNNGGGDTGELEFPFSPEEWFNNWDSNQVVDPQLEDPTNEEAPNFAPASGSPALGNGAAPSDGFFEDTDFVGAIGETDWTAGWTVAGPQGGLALPDISTPGAAPDAADHPNVECAEQTPFGQLCTITGEITEDLSIEADEGVTWLISGEVFVGNDTDETVFSIGAGVTVWADTTSDNTTFLTVRRNSKIEAVGEADNPIVFTPAVEAVDRERGLWGGLIINGNGVLNTGDEATGEGNTGTYGGDDNGDDSGTLQYVRVEYAGDKITQDNELNGIAFQGVGSGTTINYVQVHMNSDDGVEFFGGAAEAKHLVLTGIGDDSIDWTDGWQGKVQYAVVQQYGDEADRGIEADNLGDNPSQTPRSNPMFSNVTLIGGENGDTGMLLRRGTAGTFYSMLITNFYDACVDLDTEETFTNAYADGMYTGDLQIQNSIVYCEGTGDNFEALEPPEM
jgi:hypothetical protein